MNAKTWMNLCGISAWLLPGYVAIDLLLAPVPRWGHYFRLLSLTFIVALGLIGATLGVLLSVRRLRLGCPLCGQRSPVEGTGKNQLYLVCPACGPVSVTFRLFRTARADRLHADTK